MEPIVTCSGKRTVVMLALFIDLIVTPVEPTAKATVLSKWTGSRESVRPDTRVNIEVENNACY